MQIEGVKSIKYCALKTAEKSFRQAKSLDNLPPHINFRALSPDVPHVKELPCVHTGSRLFALDAPLGLFVITNFLSPDEQITLACLAVNELASPPHRTNLFIYADEYRREPTNLHVAAKPYDSHRFAVEDDERFHFNTKVRWANLGRQYDWDNRRYFAAATEIPGPLREWAISAATTAGLRFTPEAALVNYYGEDDRMGAHLDDGEPDQQRPIVSFSLGLSCIFLVGGRTKEQPPIALRLDSGDVCIMSEEARHCFHGVPRVLSNSYCRTGAQRAEDERPNSRWHTENYLSAHRINLNFRQVEPHT